MYPVTNYTLEVNGSSLNIQSPMSVENSITTNDLSENVIYTFKILAFNSVVSLSTNETEICE